MTNNIRTSVQNEYNWGEKTTGAKAAFTKEKKIIIRKKCFRECIFGILLYSLEI